MNRLLLSYLMLPLISLLPLGCRREQAKGPVTITLDWKPEPEFGGFYQADLSGAFKKHGLDVAIHSAGAGAPTWQLVASKQTEFATTAADRVLLARSKGADVVAVFAVYQTFPQGIMAHQARGFTTIEDVFTHPGTLAAEDDTWLKYLLSKYPRPRVSITGYSGGIAAFHRHLHHAPGARMDRQDRRIGRAPVRSQRRQDHRHHLVVAFEHPDQRGIEPAALVIFCGGCKFVVETKRVKERPQPRVVVCAKTLVRAERVGNARERLAKMRRQQVAVGDVVGHLAQPIHIVGEHQQPGFNRVVGEHLESVADHAGPRHFPESADMRQTRGAIAGLENHFGPRMLLESLQKLPRFFKRPR